MLTIALFEPEIPPNTGSIMRLAANTGAALALIEPLGFALDDTRLKRAGLDYREWADVSVFPSFDAFEAATVPPRVLAFTTKASQPYHTVRYAADDTLLFGPESRGLPAEMLARFPAQQRVRIPMLATSRSLNLSNAASIAVYEAWRQLGFNNAV